MQDKLNELKKRLGEISDIQNAVSLLGWDQQTYMPPGGADARAQQIATLSHLAHEKFIDDAIGHRLEELHGYASKLSYDSDDASLVRVAKRDYDKARRIPPLLVFEIAHAGAQAFDAWRKARAASEFPQFAPFLQRNLDLKIRYAECLGYTDRIYDPLLDEYEPDMKTVQIEAIFADIKKEIVPLVHAIASRQDTVDNSFLCRPFDEQKQWDIGLEVAKHLGYDFERGRQDRSPHPFTSSFSINDVRITTRFMADYFPAGFFATIHETGHALYDQGVSQSLERTLLAGGASLGVHESQSRMWENLIGRGLPFWKFLMPRARSVFPEQLRNVDAVKMYRAVNRVQPSLIRVEADEITYNLHIILRFELENMLLERRLDVKDLPDAWNTRMREYLGITPPDDAEGVLQDVHWPHGAFGYFPTYSLGNLFASQLFDQCKKEVLGLETSIEKGEFHPLLDWLRTRLHVHGRKFTLNELSNKITGKPLQTQPFITYLKNKYSEIYRL